MKGLLQPTKCNCCDALVDKLAKHNNDMLTEKFCIECNTSALCSECARSPSIVNALGHMFANSNSSYAINKHDWLCDDCLIDNEQMFNAIA